MPGAKMLAGKEKLIALLKKQAEANKPYGAICAATAQVLEPHGLLKVLSLLYLRGGGGDECIAEVIVKNCDVLTLQLRLICAG